MSEKEGKLYQNKQDNKTISKALELNLDPPSSEDIYPVSDKINAFKNWIPAQDIDEAKADFPIYFLIDTPKFTDSTAPSWFKGNHPAVKNYPQYIIKSEVDQKEAMTWFKKWFGTI